MSAARSRSARVTRQAAAVAAALAGLLLGTPLLLGGFYVGLDLPRSDVGMLCALRRALETGDGLLLSSWLGLGGPLWARVDAQVAYPVRWLQLVLPPDAGATFGAWFHLTVSAATVTWLARTFHLRPWPAIFTGVAAATCGTALNLITHALYVVPWAWVPAGWAGARVARQRGVTWGAATAGLALAATLLGGEPQGAVVLCVAAVAQLGRQPWRHWRLLGCLLGGGLVGLLPWWATLAEMALGRRGGFVDVHEGLFWSFPVEGLLAMVVPDLLAYPSSVGDSLWQWSRGSLARMPWNPTPYQGLLGLGLAALAVGQRRMRVVACAALGLGVLALGDSTPLGEPLARAVPVLLTFRYPAKYFAWCALALTLLSGAGLDALWRRPARHAARVLALLAGASVTAGVLVFVLLDPAGQAVAARHAAACVLPLLVLALAAVAASQSGYRRWAGVLWVVDLAAAIPAAVFTGPALANQPSVASVFPAAQPNTRHVVCVAPGLASIGGGAEEDGLGKPARTALFERQWLLANLSACDDVTSSVLYSPLETRAQVMLASGLDEGLMVAARALGCDVALVDGDLPGGVLVWRAPAASGGPRLSVFSIPGALPAAFVAPNPQWLDSEGALLQRLSDATAGTPVDLPQAPDPLVLLAPAAQTRVTGVERRTASQATVSLEGDGPALVVLRSQYLQGWTARQGQRPVPVVRAMGHLVAAWVPDAAAGPVVFVYVVPRRNLAAVATVLSTLVLLASCASGGRGARRSVRSPA